jgi:hypothetical protein
MKINEKQVKKMKIIFFIRNSLTSFHPETPSPLAGEGRGEGNSFGCGFAALWSLWLTYS